MPQTEPFQCTTPLLRWAFITLATLVFACASLPAGEKQIPEDRLRGLFFGMLCANSDVAQQSLPGEGELPTSVTFALRVAESMVYEGGYDHISVERVLSTLEEEEGAGIASAIQEKRSRRTSSLSGFLTCVPITMAYALHPQQGLRAGTLAVARNHPVDPEWRSAGLVYVGLLAGCLQLRSDYTRPMMINQVSPHVETQRMSEALMAVRSARRVNRNSLRPEDVLLDVIRCWYESTGYEDALSRLSPEADPLRRAMVGALAGAEYGASRIPRYRWIVLKERARYEEIFVRLDDLLREGALLAVPEEAPLLAETRGNDRGGDRRVGRDAEPAPGEEIPATTLSEGSLLAGESAPAQAPTPSSPVRANTTPVLAALEAREPASAAEVRLISASLPESSGEEDLPWGGPETVDE